MDLGRNCLDGLLSLLALLLLSCSSGLLLVRRNSSVSGHFIGVSAGDDEDGCVGERFMLGIGA